MIILINKEVKHYSDLEEIHTIGKTNSYLVYVTYIARCLYFNNFFNESIVFTPEDLENYLEKLQIIRDDLHENSKNWDYMLHYIFQDNFPIYRNNKTIVTQNTNILDVITSTIRNVIFI